MGCLYEITSPSGKKYLGITTKTAEKRFSDHVSSYMQGRKCALYSAFEKYGHDSFSVETLVISNDWEYLCDLEKRAIQAYGTMSPQGYNLTAGGEGVVGYEWTEEDIASISRAQKNRYSDPRQLKKLLEQQKLASERSFAAAMNRRVDGKPRWKARAEASRTRMGSPERSKRISEAVKAAMSKPEVRERFMSAMQARDVEAIRAGGKKNAGRKHGPASEERKAKIKERQLKSWADPVVRAKRIEALAAARAKKKAEGV